MACLYRANQCIDWRTMRVMGSTVCFSNSIAVKAAFQPVFGSRAPNMAFAVPAFSASSTSCIFRFLLGRCGAGKFTFSLSREILGERVETCFRGLFNVMASDGCGACNCFDGVLRAFGATSPRTRRDVPLEGVCGADMFSLRGVAAFMLGVDSWQTRVEIAGSWIPV